MVTLSDVIAEVERRILEGKLSPMKALEILSFSLRSVGDPDDMAFFLFDFLPEPKEINYDELYDMFRKDPESMRDELDREIEWLVIRLKLRGLLPKDFKRYVDANEIIERISRLQRDEALEILHSLEDWIDEKALKVEVTNGLSLYGILKYPYEYLPPDLDFNKFREKIKQKIEELRKTSS